MTGSNSAIFKTVEYGRQETIEVTRENLISVLGINTQLFKEQLMFSSLFNNLLFKSRIYLNPNLSHCAIGLGGKKFTYVSQLTSQSFIRLPDGSKIYHPTLFECLDPLTQPKDEHNFNLIVQPGNNIKMQPLTNFEKQNPVSILLKNPNSTIVTYNLEHAYFNPCSEILLQNDNGLKKIEFEKSTPHEKLIEMGEKPDQLLIDMQDFHNSLSIEEKQQIKIIMTAQEMFNSKGNFNVVSSYFDLKKNHYTYDINSKVYKDDKKLYKARNIILNNFPNTNDNEL